MISFYKIYNKMFLFLVLIKEEFPSHLSEMSVHMTSEPSHLGEISPKSSEIPARRAGSLVI